MHMSYNTTRNILNETWLMKYDILFQSTLSIQGHDRGATVPQRAAHPRRTEESTGGHNQQAVCAGAGSVK